MPPLHQLVVFTLDDRRYAVSLSIVERIVRLVEITPVPGAPEIVFGVINVEGCITPVVDIRKRFRLPARELALNDQLIIARTRKRKVALAVNTVTEVVALPTEEVVMGETILAHLDYVTGIVKRPDGLVLIPDLDMFLSLEEEQLLHSALDPLTL
jgi:purine-binding chemotaxis protein CheW